MTRSRTRVGTRRDRSTNPENENWALMFLGLASLSSLLWIAFFAFVNARAVGLF
jgi:hypothetical protein